MTDILYHDCTVQPEYGEDGLLLNNWNPDGPFSDREYIKVCFRIETPAYNKNGELNAHWFESTQDRAKFYDGIANAFESIGWDVLSPIWAVCGKSELYTHPQEISGIVKKWEVAYIAEKLAKQEELFKISRVDLYETVYDMEEKEILGAIG